tara:strand:+ start:80189 stop:81415 length:1227 start_codon:yes stop_codon:yes gene_type:complete
MNAYTPIAIDQPVAAAQALLPLLAEQAEMAELSGQMSADAFDAIMGAGLFQFMFPRRAGGVGHPLITHTETVAELAKADPGSAWAFGLLSSVTASVAAMPPVIREKVFLRGDELLCSVAAPTGTARPAEGGYVVNGRWGYASGCMHADYALNGVRILDDSGNSVGQGFAIIPLKRNPHTRIDITWQVAGVSASGSNTVVAEALVVPAEFIVDPAAHKNAAATASHDELAVMQANMEPRDNWPKEPLFPLVVLSPMLGAAQSLLEQVTAAMHARPVIGWDFPSKTDSAVFVQQLGQSAMEIDSAWMHVRRAINDIDVTAQRRTLSGFDKARIQADCGHAMGLLRNATSRLMDIAGPGAFASASALQRLWRDLNVGSRHTYLSCPLSEELYGRALTGLDSTMTNLPDVNP